MKPYTVVMQVRPAAKFGQYKPAKPVYVYGVDKEEAAERARRVLNIEGWDCAKSPASVKEGWPKGVSVGSVS